MPISPRPAGIPGQTGYHGLELDRADVRLLPMQWLSDERIVEARHVWSKAYGRVLSMDEAVEILMNVRRLAEVLLRAEQKEEQP